MIRVIVPIICFLICSVAESATFNVSAVKIKVYGMWVSTSHTCENPIKVFENASPNEVNLVSNPQLGGGDIPDGTYPCVMIKIGDRIQLEHSATGACEGYSIQPIDLLTPDVYSLLAQEQSARFQGMFTNSTQIRGDGIVNDILVEESAEFQGTAGEDQVFLFLSTGSTSTGKAIYHRPRQLNDSVFGEKLSSPFVVSGSTAGTLTVLGLSQITDESSQACDFVGSSGGISWSFN